MVYKKLREARTKRGMTISELARRTNLSRITITNIESGKSNPKVKTVLLICEVLNEDPRSIFFGGSVNHEEQKRIK